jgi:hypothetical protein
MTLIGRFFVGLFIGLLVTVFFWADAHQHRRLAQTDAEHHEQVTAQLAMLAGEVQAESERIDGIERRLVELHADIIKLSTSKPVVVAPVEKPRVTPVFPRSPSANR